MQQSSTQFTRQTATGILACALLLSACGGGGTSSSTPATPTTPVVAAPAITAQPQNQAVLTGATTTFSVTASGSGLSYQWLKNGTAISGATSASYTTNAASWQDNNTSYSVTVTNAGGSVTSSAAKLNLQLSPDQQIYENFSVNPNTVYEISWSQPAVGTPLINSNYLDSTHASVTVSPLTNGTQLVTNTAYGSISNTLGAGTANNPARYLINGAIVVEAMPFQANVSYSGTGIRLDELATDGSTVVYSYLRSNYTTVPLSGTTAATPTELKLWLSELAYNPLLVNSAATWQSGSAYMKFSESYINDVYHIVDNSGTTTTANVNPLATNTTLAAVMANGVTSSSDGTTYTLNNGTVSTVQGLPMYIATNPRPNQTTTEYRIYVQLNGNVYTGWKIAGGTVAGGNLYPVAAAGGGYTWNNSLQYQIRFNAAAISSLQAAYNY
jgi:hypothetical protein